MQIICQEALGAAAARRTRHLDGHTVHAFISEAGLF
jgi:hypothetical protein